PERIQNEPDLIAIFEIGVRDVELDVADPLRVSGFPFPASRLEQILESLLELPILVDQLLDAPHEVLRLRLERASRVLQLPLELATQGVRPRPGHRLSAPHSRRRARLEG